MAKKIEIKPGMKIKILEIGVYGKAIVKKVMAEGEVLNAVKWSGVTVLGEITLRTERGTSIFPLDETNEIELLAV